MEEKVAGGEVPTADRASNGIGQALAVPDIPEQPRRERVPSKNVVQQGQSEVVGIIFTNRQLPDPQMCLRQTARYDEYRSTCVRDGGRGRGNYRQADRFGGPVSKGCPERGQHFRLVKIAADREHEPSRCQIRMVKGHQVIAGDTGNRRGRTLPAKWMVRSIQQLSELPPGNTCGVVVSPADPLQSLTF